MISNYISPLFLYIEQSNYRNGSGIVKNKFILHLKCDQVANTLSNFVSLKGLSIEHSQSRRFSVAVVPSYAHEKRSSSV